MDDFIDVDPAPHAAKPAIPNGRYGVLTIGNDHPVNIDQLRRENHVLLDRIAHLEAHRDSLHETANRYLERARNAEAKRQSIDPIHKDDEGWWFWDETWAYRHGPYRNEITARACLSVYVHQLNYGVLGMPGS